MRITVKIPPNCFNAWSKNTAEKVTANITYIGRKGITCKTTTGHTLRILYNDKHVFPQIADEFYAVYPELLI